MMPGFYATYDLKSKDTKKVINQSGMPLYGQTPGDLLKRITEMRGMLKRHDSSRVMRNIRYFEVHSTSRYALACKAGYIKKPKITTKIKPMKSSKKGFTLLELIVVITIIAILVAIGGGVVSKLGSHQDQLQEDPVYFPDQPQPQPVDEQKRANDLKEQELQFLKQKWEAEQKEKARP